jgi:arabinogalactan endo-1,4-beta-galactosidase
LGADISSVQEAVDLGASYIDTDGQEKDMLQLLAAHGFNAIRLRVFVDPSSEHGYASDAGGCQARGQAYCDAVHTADFAQQVKAAGMRLLLDFHYSDTWADPAKQVVPAAWLSDTTVDQLASRVETHTRDVLLGLAERDVFPDWVQIGNEITPGMLIHEATAETDCWGNNSVERPFGGSTSNWENLAMLLKAGIGAVRDVSPESKLMLHIENTDDPEGVQWWVDNALSHGVEFDVLGLSCYTAFQGTPDVWQSTFEGLAERYPDLQFMIAEYNPERARANQIMRQLPNGRGLGTFLWEPTQSGAWGQALFTEEGGAVLRANPADFAEFDALRDVLGLAAGP